MKQIGIIGSGTMGAGIALSSSLNGFDVIVFDISKSALSNAIGRIKTDLLKMAEKEIIASAQVPKILSRIKSTTALSRLKSSDLVIEAIIEDLNAKRKLFLDLEGIVSENTILATNTSSLSVSEIASTLQIPQRALGLHFFNPVPRMKLVEVINGVHTSTETMQHATDFIKHLAKTPIVVKDVPGFIVNRIARPFYGEALKILGEGIASIEEIDRIVKLEGDFKMGPFELMDVIGIDINLAVTKSMYEQTFHEPRYKPHQIQQRMVNAGKLGKKTQIGFYSYKK